MARPPKYVYNIGDQIDDFKCINIVKDNNNQTRYQMQCQYCGKIKDMLGATIAAHKGTFHRGCGKGLGITYDKYFYQRWQGMR